MANLSSNPWNITTADVVTQAITSITLNADGTVTLVLAGVLTTAAGITVISTTAGSGVYNQFYSVISGNGTATFQLKPTQAIPAGTAAGGAVGTGAACLVNYPVRVEDLSWQQATTVGHVLDLRDRNGNPIWQATCSGAGVFNRGKIFWIWGITPIIMQSGNVLVTTN
jgi:hypothetical protein